MLYRTVLSNISRTSTLNLFRIYTKKWNKLLDPVHVKYNLSHMQAMQNPLASLLSKSLKYDMYSVAMEHLNLDHTHI